MRHDENKQVTACFCKLTAAWSDEGEVRCDFIICLPKHKNDELTLKGLQAICDVKFVVLSP